MDARRKSRLLKVAKLGLVAGGVLALVPATYLAFRSYTQQVNVFFPKRKPLRTLAEASGIPHLETVSFRANERALRGFYARSENRGAIILLHGSGGDRTSLFFEARALSKAGFGVLSFDLPGHGESEGEIHWSELERAALRAAVDWLSRRDDVDARRIGAFGFSLGGYVLAQVAPSEPRLRAVVLAGTPSDPTAQARFQHGHFGPLTLLPALFALRRGGMDLEVRARDFVGRIAPRPLLVVTGTDDGTVPRSMADELYAAAGEPKELLVIKGAGHGDYGAIGLGRYEAALVAFFERALSPSREKL
jgi:alpha-beta hydrolase superfamily lysophospholipase